MNKLIFTLLLVSFQSALGASFNCGKARSQMEKLICSDEKLSKADEELNFAYKHVVNVSTIKPIIAQWQREWLKSNEVKSCEDARCLMDAFTSRIETLKSVAQPSDNSAMWNGKYVRFFNGKKDPDSSSLLLVGLSGNRVYISGTSLWLGPNAASGQVNTGEIEGVGVTSQGKLAFDLDGCTGEVLLSKRGIVVANESGCGGLNVSFNGEYRKE
jgi:uncharacterized protein